MYYLANIRVFLEDDDMSYATDIVLVYGKTVADAMASIVEQYGDENLADVRIIPLGCYENFDGVLLIEDGIDKSSSPLLSTIKTSVTLDCEQKE